MEILDSKIRNEINKYNKLLGRSFNLSYYACCKKELAEYHYFIEYFIPAIQEAYDDYLRENFYGKSGEYNYIPCKKFQIDWFDEVFVTDKEKIPTTFQKWIKDIREKEQQKWSNFKWKLFELESWEKAWIDYIEQESIERFYNMCKDIRRNPENFSEIKNYIEYLKEAEKILHRKFI